MGILQFMYHINIPFYAAASVYPIFYFRDAIIIYFKQTNKQTRPHQYVWN